MIATRWFLGTYLPQRMDMDLMAGSVTLFLLLLIGSLSPLMTGISFVVIFPVGIFLIQWYKPKLTYSNFYVSWAVTSFFVLVGVFELEVVPYLEILMYENVIFLTLVTCSLICGLIVRKRSYDVNNTSPSWFKHNYCPWLKAAITSGNRSFFISGLIFLITALVYGAQLITTTICHPVLVHDWILIPDDCTDVLSFTFSCSIYSLVLATFFLVTLLVQMGKSCCSNPDQLVELKSNDC